MVNIVKAYKSLLTIMMKLIKIKPQKIEIESGTVMNFWVSSQSDSKPVVLLLHGFAADGIFTWQSQVFALRNKYAVYVPDLLFFGDSITNRLERSPEFQAECVAKGMKKLGVEKCIVVGFSYGGIVGFKMAELYPELVESMVVSSSVMALTESVSQTGLERIGFKSWADYLLPETVEGVKMLLQFASYNLPKWIPTWIYEDFLEAYFGYREEKIELLDAMLHSGKNFTIPKYSQRFCLLWGQNDQLFDMEVARDLKEKLGENATLEHIEKAGHIVIVERPFEYNRRLKAVLASWLVSI